MDSLYLADEHDVPLVPLPFDRRRLDRTFQRAMVRAAHIPNFRQVHLAGIRQGHSPQVQLTSVGEEAAVRGVLEIRHPSLPAYGSY